MAIYFEQGSAHEIGGDVVAFRGDSGGVPMDGFITREALEDLWVPAPALPSERWLSMFDTIEAQVFEIAEAKIRHGRLEPDGSVMISAGDRENL